MSNVIIGAIDLYQHWSQVAPWAISAREHHDGDIIVLAYRTSDEIISNLKTLSIDVYPVTWNSFGKPIQYGADTPVHELRFFHLWQLLSTTDYDTVVATDVRDVLFQRNPFQRIEDNNLLSERPLLASAESLTYAEEPWGEQNLCSGFGEYWWDAMKDKVIYNVGVLAGKQDEMVRLFASIYTMTEGRFHPSDQSAYSILVNNIYPEWFTKVDHDMNWACQGGTTLDRSKSHYFGNLHAPRPYIKDGRAYTYNEDKIFAIFHQWDRTDAKTIIEQEYA